MKSGHGNGKSFIASVVSIWRWNVGFPCGVITTAPTGRQINAILWAEIRTRWRVLEERVPTKGRALDTPAVKHPHPKALFIGFATKEQPEFFQGFHRKSMTVITDESAGIPPAIWLGIEGVLTGDGDFQLSIGNPSGDLSSEWHAMFTKHRALYKCFTLDSRRSSFCAPSFVQRIARKYGEGSPVWQIKVEGNFPRESSDTLVALAWIEAAQARYADADAAAAALAARTLGVDVARYGSALTVLAEMVGRRAPKAEFFEGQDLMKTVGEIVRRIRAGVAPGDVRVDDTGVGGGATDRLLELGHDVVPVNFGAATSDPAQFGCLRDELLWSLRERFREGRIDLDPEDEDVVADLCALRYTVDSKGRIRIEAKEQARKRLGRSPDRADALALAAMGQELAGHARSTFKGPGPSEGGEGAYRVGREGATSGYRVRGGRR